MPDREKVIKGLEICKERNYCCTECPYYDLDAAMGCHSNELMADALALLKEQEMDTEALKKSYKELAEKGEPIVRCKDCKWWDKKDGANYGYCHACKHGYYSDHWEIGIYRTYKGDFFCADGERRTGDD